MRATSCLAMVVLALARPAVGQDASFEVALRDGSILVTDALADLDGGRVRVNTRLRPEDRSWKDILSIHGAAVPDPGLPSVILAGGEVLRGMIVGGDEGGDVCEVESRALGRVRVPVDRIECVLLRDDLARAGDLRLPDGVDEALFTKAAIGFDLQAGSIFKFGALGVSFQPVGDAAPRWFRWQDLVGIRLRDPAPRPTPASAELVTRAGDQVGVELRAWRNGKVEFALEQGRAVQLPASEVASLLFLAGVVPLSTLTPKSVAEAGCEGDVLLPWQRDRSAHGGLLRCGGHTWGRGLGVHTRSRLTFTVPAGVDRFWTRVAIDDSVLALAVRGDADVQVLVNGKVAFARAGLRGGQPPVSTGLLPVKPGDELELFADFGKGRELGDRVDWLGAVFLAAGRP